MTKIQPKTVHSFEKNAVEEVRASTVVFRGREYVDLRVFYEKDGAFHPSKKGLTLNPELIPELEKAIGKLKAEVESWEH